MMSIGGGTFGRMVRSSRSILAENGVGRWTIEGDRLCMAEESAADAECLLVWIREDEVILRLSDSSTGLIGSIRIHEGH